MKVTDRAHLRGIVEEYQRRGFQVALDDFGAGYCGLNLLADFPADIVKLDMELTRNLHLRPAAREIVQSLVGMARRLGIQLVAEGVETEEEYTTLRSFGIRLMQGFLLARPGFERLPEFHVPGARTGRSAAAAQAPPVARVQATAGLAGLQPQQAW